MTEIRAVIFDLDDVVRHFDRADDLENRFGLAHGTLAAVAYSAELLESATTGQVTYEQWIASVGDELARRHGEPARAAAAAWGALPCQLDQDVVVLAHELAGGGIVTAILTNGTTRVEAECAALGVPDHFDPVFNSARIGYAKPDRRVFEHVVERLGIPAPACAFTDDNERKLAGAIEIGMATHHYTGVEKLRAWLGDDLGLLC
jgi:putative hydrolase of the HAD superfamily